MITETAKVSAVEAGKLWLETEITSTCSSCVQANQCGTSTIAKAFNGKKNLIGVEFSASDTVAVGQQVVLGIQESTIVSASALIYLVPTLVLVITALITQQLTTTANNSELLAITLSFLSSAISFWLIRKHVNAPENLAKYYPQIVDIKPNLGNIQVKRL